jgi:hypothetical protein
MTTSAETATPALDTATVTASNLVARAVARVALRGERMT